MQELDDQALLGEYVKNGSEEAFAALVSRHVNRVYSVALRHTGNPHQAEEITQAVFVILATKAARFRKGVILAGWLYQTARLTSLTFIRGEIRRAHREHEAHMQNTTNEGEPEVWRQIAPLLDRAMSSLNETDRQAIVLRFFYGRSMNEIGSTLGASESAATLRLHRAMDKLRLFFARRGVISTTDLIAGAMSAHSLQVAPATLAGAATAAALARGAAASGPISTLSKGALKLMAWTKMKTALVAGAALLAAAGTTTGIVKYIHSRPLNESSWQLSMRSLLMAPRVAAVRPSRHGGAPGTISTFSRLVARNVLLGSLLFYAYSPPNYYYDTEGGYHVVLPPDLADGKYDLLLTLPDHAPEALRAEIRKKLGLTAHFESRETEVMLLTAVSPASTRLIPSHGNGSVRLGRGWYNFTNEPMHILTDYLEGYYAKPVVDQTGLTGYYTGSMKWPHQSNKAAELEAIQKALLDQLGLELVSNREPINMLVVERTKN